MELTHKRDFDAAVSRLKAWWDGGLGDRFPVICTAPNPRHVKQSVSLKPDEYHRWYLDGGFMVRLAQETVGSRLWLAEAVPHFTWVFPLGPCLGGRATLEPGLNVWNHKSLDAREDLAGVHVDADCAFNQRAVGAWREVARAAQGNFLVDVPWGFCVADVLSLMRGSEEFMLDLADDPEAVFRAVGRVVNESFVLMDGFYDMALRTAGGAGSVAGLGVFTPGLTFPVQSDISCMISPALFARMAQHDVIPQMKHLHYGTYHLDGPGAVKHLDFLLSIPELRLIQWVPGDGALPFREWIPLLKRIVDAGKRTIVYCAPKELETFVSALGPERIVVMTGVSGAEEGRALLAEAERLTARYRREGR